MDCFIRGYVFSPLFLQNTSGSAAANKKQKNYVYQNSTRIFLKSNSTHKGSWWSRLVPHSVLPIFLSFFFFFKPHQAACKGLVSSCCCRRQITSVLSDSVQPHRRQPTRLPRPWDSPGKNTRVGCHFLLQCMKVKSESEVAQSCLTLSDPTDCSLPGSSIHGIFQARVLDWDAITMLS